MYEFIKGLLVDKDPLRAIVEAGGIGYRLTIPLSTYTQLPAIKTVVQLYISHIVREDAEFWQMLEKRFLRLLSRQCAGALSAIY